MTVNVESASSPLAGIHVHVRGEELDIAQAGANRVCNSDPKVAEEFILNAATHNVSLAETERALMHAGFTEAAVVGADKMFVKQAKSNLAKLGYYPSAAVVASSLIAGYVDRTMRSALERYRADNPTLGRNLSADALAAKVNERATEIQARLRDLGFDCPQNGTLDVSTVQAFVDYKIARHPTDPAVINNDISFVGPTLDKQTLSELDVEWTAKRGAIATELAKHNLERLGYLSPTVHAASGSTGTLDAAASKALGEFRDDNKLDTKMSLEELVTEVNQTVTDIQVQLRGLSIDCPLTGKIDDATLRAFDAYKFKRGIVDKGSFADNAPSEGNNQRGTLDKATLEQLRVEWLESNGVTFSDGKAP